MTYVVRRTGRTWSIFEVYSATAEGKLVEGGFFYRDAALAAAAEWRAGTR